MQNEDAFMRTLTNRECAVFFPLRRGTCVRIAFLYSRFAINGASMTPKKRQQHVGAVISILNRKLSAQGFRYIIRPGETRQTYKLYSINDAAAPRA